MNPSSQQSVLGGHKNISAEKVPEEGLSVNYQIRRI